MNKNRPLTKSQIFGTLRRHQRALRQYSVKRIGLFGSFVRGQGGTKSDLDFVVEFEQPTFDNFMHLHTYLEELFGRKVDLLTPDGVQSIHIKSIAEDIQRSVAYV